MGGVGESALVNHWLNRMDLVKFRGAVSVYGWSFYSQGASEDRQASADDFFDSTLKWFSDPDPTQGSPWDKGVRLADLIRKERILEEMEPLFAAVAQWRQAGLLQEALYDVKKVALYERMFFPCILGTLC